MFVFKELCHGQMGLTSLAKLFNCIVCNPCQSSPSLTILVPLWFIIISLVFFHLCKVLFSGFLQLKGKFVDGQNTSKYRDRAPLRSVFLCRVNAGNAGVGLVKSGPEILWKYYLWLEKHVSSCRLPKLDLTKSVFPKIGSEKR